MSKRFTKNTRSKEAFNILMYDIGCLEMLITGDNMYHKKMLIDNLKDLFGVVALD